jgi:hypothetical protein
MPRKGGSNVLTGATGGALLILGLAILASFVVDIRANRVIVNGGGCILLDWFFCGGPLLKTIGWGIGFETVTMTVTVVTAVIAILALNAAP